VSHCCSVCSKEISNGISSWLHCSWLAGVTLTFSLWNIHSLWCSVSSKFFDHFLYFTACVACITYLHCEQCDKLRHSLVPCETLCQCCIRTAEQTELVFHVEATLGLSYVVLVGNLFFSKNKGISLWNFTQNSELSRLFCFYLLADMPQDTISLWTINQKLTIEILLLIYFLRTCTDSLFYSFIVNSCFTFCVSPYCISCVLTTFH